MEENKFKALIDEVVRDLMGAKDEAEKLAAAERAVEAAKQLIADLDAALDGKVEELAALSEENTRFQEQVEKFSAKVKELEDALSAAEKRATEAEGRATAAEQALAAIEHAKVLALRVAELESAKVIALPEKFEEQKARIAAMSDEEFAGYKAERVELRERALAEVRAELAAAAPPVVEPGEPVEPVVEVAAADIAAARREEAALILDVELISEDALAKYRQLGEALAAKNRK